MIRPSISSSQAGISQKPTLVVVTAVNDEAVFQQNLAASPPIQRGDLPLVVQRGHSSAATALNAGLDHSDADVVVFAHQDVFLPSDWVGQLRRAMDQLALRETEWAVLGLVGATAAGEIVGHSWSTGLSRIVGSTFHVPRQIVSVDEIVIVLNTQHGLRFDESIPGFHLYGTDIVQTARKRGLESFVIDAPVIHNSLAIRYLENSYRDAYRWMQQKWCAALPIATCVVPVSRSAWPLCSFRLRLLKRRLVGYPQNIRRESDPAELARRLGFDE